MNKDVRNFLKDIKTLSLLPTAKKFSKLTLPEYPFDHQLLTASSLYRESRKSYVSLGGAFSAKVCSMMRGLSDQDLFKNVIEYTPSFSEIMWFQQRPNDVTEPLEELRALARFNEISVYHEQNHRVIWQLLPPAPPEPRDLSRYLNFAECLVVVLDLALGDQLGLQNSKIFQGLNLIYRHGGQHPWAQVSKSSYRKYLLALLCATYYALEWMHDDDILKAVDYVLPNQKKANRAAITRGKELSELFTRVTNPEWQQRNLKISGQKLKKMHFQSKEDPLYLPEDPLDLEEEFIIARSIFDHYGL